MKFKPSPKQPYTSCKRQNPSQKPFAARVCLPLRKEKPRQTTRDMLHA